jgi:hypothetical protein
MCSLNDRMRSLRQVALVELGALVTSRDVDGNTARDLLRHNDWADSTVPPPSHPLLPPFPSLRLTAHALVITLHASPSFFFFSWHHLSRGVCFCV